MNLTIENRNYFSIRLFTIKMQGNDLLNFNK